jgi:hypothetical protein
VPYPPTLTQSHLRLRCHGLHLLAPVVDMEHGPPSASSPWPVDYDHLFVLVSFDNISKSRVRLLLLPFSTRGPSPILRGTLRGALTSGGVVRSCSTGQTWCGAAAPMSGGLEAGHPRCCVWPRPIKLRTPLTEVWWLSRGIWN